MFSDSFMLGPNLLNDLKDLLGELNSLNPGLLIYN